MLLAIKSVLVGVGVVGGLIALFIGLFLINKHTPVPKGCENLEAECEGCPITSCLKNKTINKEEKENVN